MRVVGNSNSLVQRGSGREKDIELQCVEEKRKNTVQMFSKRKNHQNTPGLSFS